MIVAVGHASLDYVYKIDAFSAIPTKLRAIEHVVSGGGMAANASASIARLGGTVEIWGRVGEDRIGEIVLQELQADGVGTNFLRPFAGCHSPTAAVIVDRNGDRLVVSEDDRELPLAADWLPLDRIGACRVVLSDLTWLEGTLAAFAKARSDGVPTLLDIDLGSASLVPMVIELTDYAIFSAPAFERCIEGRNDAMRLEQVLASGVRHAGVTRGARGYFGMNNSGVIVRQDVFQVDVVDTTGAGDAFHGGFAWALSEGYNDVESARLASAVAALSCRKLGARAGLPAKAELEAFLVSSRVND
ncbi:MAG: PfkB family carbohydrate kinase [Hyphomicrobium sp.]